MGFAEARGVAARGRGGLAGIPFPGGTGASPSTSRNCTAGSGQGQELGRAELFAPRNVFIDRRHQHCSSRNGESVPSADLSDESSP